MVIWLFLLVCLWFVDVWNKSKRGWKLSFNTKITWCFNNFFSVISDMRIHLVMVIWSILGGDMEIWAIFCWWFGDWSGVKPPPPSWPHLGKVHLSVIGKGMCKRVGWCFDCGEGDGGVLICSQYIQFFVDRFVLFRDAFNRNHIGAFILNIFCTNQNYKQNTKLSNHYRYGPQIYNICTKLLFSFIDGAFVAYCLNSSSVTICIFSLKVFFTERLYFCFLQLFTF